MEELEGIKTFSGHELTARIANKKDDQQILKKQG